MIGGRYGHLVILGVADTSPQHHRLVKVRCDCGNVKVMRLANLRFGNSFSCGCQQFQRNAWIPRTSLDRISAEYGLRVNVIQLAYKTGLLDPVLKAAGRVPGKRRTILALCKGWGISRAAFYSSLRRGDFSRLSVRLPGYVSGEVDSSTTKHIELTNSLNRNL